MPNILEGVRVLDFGRYIAGPFCGSLLADMGADVVRIETPKGGDDRFLMPATEHGEGGLYLSSNRGKQCLTLDMGSPRGREVQKKLIEQADIVIANFSPGALKHFGLDYETVKAIKKDVILVTVSAYGTEGPLKDSVGFDGVGQAVSAALYLTGIPDHPYRSVTSYVDFTTALSCAYGTLAAYIRKMKTGEGAHVESSLAGSAIGVMAPIIIEHAGGQNPRVPMGNRSPIAGPSDVFRARDGWFIMQAIGQQMFKRWTKIIDRADLLDDPRYANDMLRGKNSEELSRITSEWAATRTRDECLAVLAKANIGAGPVLTPDELLGGALDLRSTFMEEVPFPDSGKVPLMKSPVRLDGANEPIRRPPLLGEHSEEVLARYGFGKSEIEALRRDKVV